MTARHLTQHAGDQQALQPDLASGDFGNRFEEDFGGALLEYQADSAETHSVAVHLDVADSGQHDHMGVGHGGLQVREQVQSISLAQIEVQQDDVRLLPGGYRERVLRAGALAHYCDARLAVEEHP